MLLSGGFRVKKRYYKNQYLGVIGVVPGHQSGKCTFLSGSILKYTWIRTKDLYKTRKEAERASVAKFELVEQDDL